MNVQVAPMNPFGVVVSPREGRPPITDLNQTFLRELFDAHQLVLIRGFETFENADALSRYCERWGELSVWPFGTVLELVEQESAGDHIFDNSSVPLHWDGMYRPQVPEIQIFHCVHAPGLGQGGRTTFSNTRLVLDHASAENRNLWMGVTGVYERKMEFYESRTSSPLITRHPFKDYSVIRYNEPHSDESERFINPPRLQFLGVPDEDMGRFHRELRQNLFDARHFYAHDWISGDVVISDNFTLLHGRENFVSKSGRHLQRVQVLSNPPLNNPGLESYQ